jgi:CheY-like chemotaxis protein
MNSAAALPQNATDEPPTVLVMEREVLIRSSVAHYLRSCGYRVLEARNAPEAITILQESRETIRVVLCDAENGFRLSGWVKANRPKTRIVLAATADRAAQAAAELCDSGPHQKRPYDPQLLIQEIKASLGRQ